MKDHEKRIREALEVGPVQYACHVDGDVDKSCAFDPGQNVYDCVLANRLSAKGLCKTDCEEWKPINLPKSTIEVSAANLRALLADLEAMRGARTDVCSLEPVGGMPGELYAATAAPQRSRSMTDLVSQLVGALELCQRALQSQWSPYMRAGEKEAAAMKAAATALSAAKDGGWVAVHQFRADGCADWYDGFPDQQDGGGPYETRTLYALPNPPKEQNT